MNLFILRAYMQARFTQNNQDGANMVEYVLLLAFIALIVIGAVTVLGNTVSKKFDSANTALG